ncbi:hypothetical protein LWI28_011837 [Acer negundo]|uniref:Protein kinase domain-containing protein n=1 Tax=Acer negundo TaxID=4023 RepID=A0AAD5IJ44_ACENE|nr:hypothetical protein LWI28_011837 [Acer negundo]
MGSHRRSFFTEPNPKEYLGTCNNDSSSLEFPTSCSSAGKSQFSDVVSKVNFQPVAAGQEFQSWDIRLKIAIVVGRCLAFLHTLEKKIIYKPLVYCLTRLNYKAKLSDFGLAMLGPSSEESPILTAVSGTYGYAAPEYIATGNIYLKSDVYGHGIMLLELLTGLRAIDMNCSGEQKNLGQYSAEAAFHVAELSLKCIESDPQSQLSMKEVVEVLKEIEAL